MRGELHPLLAHPRGAAQIDAAVAHHLKLWSPGRVPALRDAPNALVSDRRAAPPEPENGVSPDGEAATPAVGEGTPEILAGKQGNGPPAPKG